MQGFAKNSKLYVCMLSKVNLVPRVNPLSASTLGCIMPFCNLIGYLKYRYYHSNNNNVILSLSNNRHNVAVYIMESKSANCKSIMAANAPSFWPHLIEVYQGVVQSASWSVHDHGNGVGRKSKYRILPIFPACLVFPWKVPMMFIREIGCSRWQLDIEKENFVRNSKRSR